MNKMINNFFCIESIIQELKVIEFTEPAKKKSRSSSGFSFYEKKLLISCKKTPFSSLCSP